MNSRLRILLVCTLLVFTAHSETSHAFFLRCLFGRMCFLGNIFRPRCPGPMGGPWHGMPPGGPGMGGPGMGGPNMHNPGMNGPMTNPGGFPNGNNPGGFPNGNNPGGFPNGNNGTPFQPNAPGKGMPPVPQKGMPNGGGPTGSADTQTAQGFLAWVNQVRSAAGLRPVGYDKNLEAYADQNNAAQASRGLGHHVMPPAVRGKVVQNAAMGGAQSMAQQWWNSAPHKANILDPGINAIGVSCAGQWCTMNGAYL